MGQALVPNTALSPKVQSTVQVAANLNMNIPPTATESEHLIYIAERIVLMWTRCSSFFLNTCILLRELLHVVPNLHHVHWGLGSAKSGQKGDENYKRTFSSFGTCSQDRLTNNRQGAVISCDNCHQQTEIKR